jgi:GNAT superfamily N-acetyltransferase
MVDGYTITLAEPEHLVFLSAIELEAAQLFADWDVPASILAESTSLEEFRELQRAGLLWVALSDSGQPVGFAAVEKFADSCHLEELDVHPDHGRKGLGSALVRAVCSWASRRGFQSVTLTTYRDVPWNAPLYARLGFHIVAPDELGSALETRVREEAERGLATARRVVMRCTTGAPSSAPSC